MLLQLSLQLSTPPALQEVVLLRHVGITSLKLQEGLHASTVKNPNKGNSHCLMSLDGSNADLIQHLTHAPVTKVKQSRKKTSDIPALIMHFNLEGDGKELTGRGTGYYRERRMR